MDHSKTSARYFSRLVGLLLKKAPVEEQKAALQALATAIRDGPVVLTTQDWLSLVAAVPPDELGGIQQLVAQLLGHGIQEIAIDQGAAPGAVLALARLVASAPAGGDRGAAVKAKLAALNTKAVRAVVELDGAAATTQLDALPDDINWELEPDPNPMSLTDASGAGVAAQQGIFETHPAFTAMQMPQAGVPELFAQIDASTSQTAIARYLEDLVAIAATAASSGTRLVVADALHGLVKREAEVASADSKLAFTLAIRRLATPTVLTAIAELLPAQPDRYDQLLAVLGRTGDEGADATIQLLAAAPTRGERRVYFDALVQLRASVTVLVHMLGDRRWYVARNAAELLGELGDPAGETALIQALQHSDERVRSSSAAALTRIGAPRALEALREALRDVSPRVRTSAVAGLAVRKVAKSATALIAALDKEESEAVQIAILEALGRLATPEAVEKLIEAAKAEGWLFRKKTATYRAAAAQALGEAHTPAALVALNDLANDRERLVRDAVTRGLA